MNRILVTPLKPNVPKADGSILAEAGEELDASRWWRRRERDGDVRLSAPAKPKTVKPALKATEKKDS